ncbi:MAG: hypothetical protein IH597_10875 [Bacteroidales bacterium]|nr:hypothetical protein [Bacteroidales bacterium]
MKNLIFTLVFACTLAAGLNAQDVNAQLSEAKSSYNSGDLQSTRFALQQAINEIDKAIGAEIMKILPTSMGDLSFIESSDNITATSSGFAGVFVSRSYGAEDETNASLQVISDSPMLAGVNALLAMPMFVSDPSQKKIKVGSYRALLQKTEDENGVSWDVQIPVRSTLITLHTTGIDTEKAVTEMAGTIPVDQIAKFAQ